jgi:hypothetical protein
MGRLTSVIDYSFEIVKAEQIKGRQLAEDLFPTGREFNLYLRSLLDEDRAETFEKLLKAIDEKVQ